MRLQKIGESHFAIQVQLCNSSTTKGVQKAMLNHQLDP